MSQNQTQDKAAPAKGKYRHIVLHSIAVCVLLVSLVLSFMTLLEWPRFAWGWIGNVPSEKREIITAFWIFAGVLLSTFFEFIRVQVESVDLAERLRSMEDRFGKAEQATAGQLSAATAEIVQKFRSMEDTFGKVEQATTGQLSTAKGEIVNEFDMTKEYIVSQLDSTAELLGTAKADIAEQFIETKAEMAEKFEAARKDIIEQLDNTIECRYVGLGQKTVQQIVERLERAEEVKNTYVLFGIGESDTYAQGEFELFHEAIRNFLDKGGSWSDIISQGVISSPAEGWLGVIVKLYEKAGDDPNKKAGLERYKIHRLKESYPLINFTILRYKDDTREVIFGWGHHAEDPTGRVFVSRSEPLISSFEQYWHMLEKDSILVHPAVGQMKLRTITPSDITGLWVRVSFYLDRSDWKAEHGPPPGESLHDVALVKINIDDNRKLVVEGKRFKVEAGGGVSGEHGFESKAADIEKFSLWFATTSNSEEKLHIAGWYEFTPDAEPIWSKSVRIREFYGEFVEYEKDERLRDDSTDRHTFNMKVGRLILFGTRVRKHWLVRYEEGADRPCTAGDYIDDFPSAPERQAALVKECLEWWRKEGEPRRQGGCSPDA